MKASIAGAAGLFNAPLSQAARLFAALQAKTPAEAVEESSTDDAAAVEAPVVDEAPASDDAPVSEDTTEDAGSEG
jgi:large subunit ribosomal protein L10